MTDELHPSVPAMWYSFVAEQLEYSRRPMPEAFYLGTNQETADMCAVLVKAGIKTASSGALDAYANYEVPIPKVGDLAIITNYNGEAQCIIETTDVNLVPFNEVTEEYAMLEGEGDQSLDYWKQTHWAFFSEDLSSFGGKASEEMLVICEEFKVVHQ